MQGGVWFVEVVNGGRWVYVGGTSGTPVRGGFTVIYVDQGTCGAREESLVAVVGMREVL